MWSMQGDTKVCVVLLTHQSSWCAVIRGHSDAVLCLQFVGDTLVSGSSDQTIKVVYNTLVIVNEVVVQVWSLPQGQCKMTLHGHQAAVTSVQFDQSRIISGSLDRFIKIWSINSGQVRMRSNDVVFDYSL